MSFMLVVALEESKLVQDVSALGAELNTKELGPGSFQGGDFELQNLPKSPKISHGKRKW